MVVDWGSRIWRGLGCNEPKRACDYGLKDLGSSRDLRSLLSRTDRFQLRAPSSRPSEFMFYGRGLRRKEIALILAVRNKEKSNGCFVSIRGRKKTPDFTSTHGLSGLGGLSGWPQIDAQVLRAHAVVQLTYWLNHTQRRVKRWSPSLSTTRSQSSHGKMVTEVPYVINIWFTVRIYPICRLTWSKVRIRQSLRYLGGRW